ncbi:hypothetical protein RRG08_048472, partial [Elysia crispata]
VTSTDRIFCDLFEDVKSGLRSTCRNRAEAKQSPFNMVGSLSQRHRQSAQLPAQLDISGTESGLISPDALPACPYRRQLIIEPITMIGQFYACPGLQPFAGVHCTSFRHASFESSRFRFHESLAAQRELPSNGDPTLSLQELTSTSTRHVTRSLTVRVDTPEGVGN